MDRHNHTNSRESSSASTANWVPGPLAEGFIARHWRRLVLRAQSLLREHTWTADQRFRHTNRVQATLPRNVYYQYPFNSDLNDPVVTDACCIVALWINDTIPHISASQGVLEFMSNLQHNINHSDFIDTMGYHFVLYKTIVPYIHEWVVHRGIEFWSRHGFEAWLDRQHPAMHDILRNVETGLRRRLSVWYHPLVLARWEQMVCDYDSYQTSPPQSTEFRAAWFDNRPEYRALFCNYQVDRRLALALNTIADLDFSNENMAFERPGHRHWPHRGCREKCPLVGYNRLGSEDLETAESHQTNNHTQLSAGIPRNSSIPSNTTELEDETPYGQNCPTKLRRRPAFRSLRTNLQRRSHSCPALRGGSYNSADERKPEAMARDARGSSHIALAKPTDMEDSSDEGFDTPSNNGSSDDDDWDNTWNSEAGSGQRDLPIINRPPTPFARGCRPTANDPLTSQCTRANAQIVIRPATPHPRMGRLRQQNRPRIAGEGIPPLDLGSPLIPIEEPGSQTPVHVIISTRTSLELSSHDTNNKDTTEQLDEQGSDWDLVNNTRA